MKLFEIEVVRTYTTTIEVALPDHLHKNHIEYITRGEMDHESFLKIQDIYNTIWDTLGEAELEQCDTDILTVKAKINQ